MINHRQSRATARGLVQGTGSPVEVLADTVSRSPLEVTVVIRLDVRVDGSREALLPVTAVSSTHASQPRDLRLCSRRHQPLPRLR